MAGIPQSLTQDQRDEVKKLLRRQILSGTLILFALLAGIFGVSLWQIKGSLERGMKQLIANQFEEPRIKAVVSDVARIQAKALMVDQINPEVEGFKKEVASQLLEIKSLVADIQMLQSQGDSNAKQIEAILASTKKSQEQIEQTGMALSAMNSDLVALQRGLVEIQYFTYKGRNTFPNPYHERIMQRLNDLLKIGVPNAAERAKFVQEMESYQLKE